jgi:hypothetical protein
MTTDKTDNLKRIWRAKLDKLTRHRYGNNFLPEDDNGRDMLTALLVFGLSDDSAIESAPWCGAELPALKRRARCIKWKDVGELIQLTLAEREEIELWLEPFNMTPAELRARKSAARSRGPRANRKDAKG